MDATAIDVPTMLIGGWADAYADAILRAYGQVRGPKKQTMGPWMHVLPHLSAPHPYDWVSAMADWWDTHLRRDPPQPEPGPPVLFFTSGGGWRAARQWPPGEVSTRYFYLDGYRLAAAPPQARAGVTPRRSPGRLAAGIWDRSAPATAGPRNRVATTPAA